MARKSRKLLLGLGLDDSKGHKRITKGENFLLMGGSKEAHEYMTEKAIKFNEELKKRGTNLDDVNTEELDSVAHKLDLYPVRKKIKER